MHATYPVLPIALEMAILVIFGEEYKSCSFSLFDFLQFLLRHLSPILGRGEGEQTNESHHAVFFSLSPNRHFNTETSNTIRDVFIEFSLQAPSFFLVGRKRRCHGGLAPVCSR